MQRLESQLLHFGNGQGKPSVEHFLEGVFQNTVLDIQINLVTIRNLVNASMLQEMDHLTELFELPFKVKSHFPVYGKYQGKGILGSVRIIHCGAGGVGALME